MSVTAHLLVSGLLALGGPSPQAPISGPSDVVLCGGQTDLATVQRYFAELRAALAQPTPNSQFNRFVAPTFGIRSKTGTTLYYKMRDFRSITPGRIGLQEWQEISRRGPQDLRDAGWRGCFLDHGKVWFEGSKEKGFGLKFLARDLPWMEPAGAALSP